MKRRRLVIGMLAVAALLFTGGCAPKRARTWVDLTEVSGKIEKKADDRTVLDAAVAEEEKGTASRVKDLSPADKGTNEYLNLLAPPKPVSLPTPKGDEIGLNFDNADIYEFIQVVADALGMDYIVDPQVKGVVNIRSGKAIGKDNLFTVFKKILNINGVDIRKEGGLYYIYPSKAPAAPLVQDSAAIAALSESSRMVMQVVPIMHLAAAEAVKLIQPYLSEHGLIHNLESQNTLIIQDFESKVIDGLTVLARIDVSPLASLKVRLVRVEKAPLFQLRDELIEIFAALKINKKEFEGLSVVPMERVNSLLLVSKSGFLLDTADSWIRELDAVPSEGRDNIYIYNVRNSVASELATLVNSLISGEDLGDKKTTAKKDKTSTRKDTKTTDTTPSSSTAKTDANVSAQTPSAKGLAGLRFAGEPMLLSDDTRNVILIRALQPDYSRIIKILERLDNLPRQVLIEVMVAEVRLTDNWEFGVEWALKNDKLKINNSNNYTQKFATNFSGVVEAASGGFTYSVLRGTDVVGLLNAIASETDVSLLSSPQILVLNNEEAMVNVGDQVPIVTTATERGTAETPVIDKTVQYKDTGTILTVKPRINYDGIIILDVQQQVSQASTTKTSGIDSPTISTREIKTKLAVKNGQSILMGGLIRKDGTVTEEKVPLVGDIPLLGWLFKYEKDTTTKTELLVMITPYVIETEDVLDQYIRQFQEKMQELRRDLTEKKPPKKS